MSLLKWVLAVAGVLVVAGLWYGATHPKPQMVIDGTQVDVTAIAQAVLDKVEQNLGAASSPAVVDGCTEIDGVTRCYRSSSMTQNASTTCTLRAPTSGTSTLTFAAARFNTASTAALTWVEIGKAASIQATTTVLGRGYFAADTKGTVLATTTPLDALDEDKTFNPGWYLNVKIPGGGTGSAPIGKCVAEWIVH